MRSLAIVPLKGKSPLRLLTTSSLPVASLRFVRIRLWSSRSLLAPSLGLQSLSVLTRLTRWDPSVQFQLCIVRLWQILFWTYCYGKPACLYQSLLSLSLHLSSTTKLTYLYYYFLESKLTLCINLSLILAHLRYSLTPELVPHVRALMTIPPSLDVLG